MQKGVSTVTINREPAVVFRAITDITRMADWNRECASCAWLSPATGPVVGARFECVDRSKLGPVTVKRRKTTNEVTKYIENEAFEFVAGGFTHWRYEFIEIDGATRLTESFHHEPFTGISKILHETVRDRRKAMVSGMQMTLERVKVILEGGAS